MADPSNPQPPEVPPPQPASGGPSSAGDAVEMISVPVQQPEPQPGPRPPSAPPSAPTPHVPSEPAAAVQDPSAFLAVSDGPAVPPVSSADPEQPEPSPSSDQGEDQKKQRNNNDMKNKKRKKKKKKKKKKELDEIMKGGVEEVEAGEKVSIRELYRYCNRTDKILMGFGILCCILNGAVMPAFAEVFSGMVEFIGDPDTEPILNEDGDVIGERIVGMVDNVTGMILYLVLFAVGTFLLSWFSLAFFIMVAERLTYEIRKKYVESVLRQDMTWFDQQKIGELGSRLTTDTVAFQTGSGEKVAMLVTNLSMGVFGIGFGLVRGWQMALVMLSIAPFVAAAGDFMARALIVQTKNTQTAYAKAGTVANAALAGIRTVTSFGTQREEIERYNQHLDSCRKAGERKHFFTGLSMGAFQTLALLSDGLALWFGVWLIANNVTNSLTGSNYTGGDVLAVFFSVMIGTMGIAQATPSMPYIAAACTAAFRLYGVIDREPEIDAHSEEGLKPEGLIGNIQLENLSFKYPTRPDLPVLRGLNISIAAGQQVALVGESGAGKSSVLGLLERYYDPEEGRILIDGNDLRDLNLQWWRSQVGIVSQMPTLFVGTIAENIRFGRPDATQEEVEDAARKANAHDFIVTLPKGYDTEVGTGGGSLSGGQKQRIAIARAVIKDPKLLILDEATSALDNESEKLVQTALDRLMKGRTVVVVAHRLSTVINSDKIYVLRRGQVVEQGTHAELIAAAASGENEGVYASLVHASDAGEAVHSVISQQQQQQQSPPGSPSLPAAPGAGALAEAAVSESSPAAQDGEEVKEAEGILIGGGEARPPAKMENEEEGEEKEKKDGEDEKLPKEDAPKVPYSRVYQIAQAKRGHVSLAIVSGVIAGLMFPFWAVAFSEISGIFYEEDYETQRDESLLWAGIIWGIAILVGISETMLAYGLGVAGEHITHELRSKSFQSLVRQPVSFFDDPRRSSHILSNRLSTEATLVSNGGPPKIAIFLRTGTTLVAGIAIGFIGTWAVTLVMLGVLPVLILSGVAQMKLITGFADDGKKAFEAAGQVSSEAMENIRTVVAFTSEEQVTKRFAERLELPLQLGKRKGHVVGIAFGVSQAVFYLVFALCFYVGAILVEDGDLTLDSLMMGVFGLFMASMGVAQASTAMPDLAESDAAKDQLFFLVDLESPIDPFSTGGLRPNLDAPDLEFRDVRFSYPRAPDREVLKGISFQIPAGSTYALVGQSGCGKSTLVSLIMRWYELNSGEILISGHRLQEINIAHLRSHIGYVGQEPHLFDMSVADNIRYGCPGATMDDVVEAAKLANIHDFIVNELEQEPDSDEEEEEEEDGDEAGVNLEKKKPRARGYDTMVGEKGGQLSGGQRQRVSIARALIRRPRILLLDEATSALDTESEKLVQEALDNLLSRRQGGAYTTIVIAHRLSTIQRSDKIVVMDSGSVAEIGNHEELMQRQGMYWALVQAGGAAGKQGRK